MRRDIQSIERLAEAQNLVYAFRPRLVARPQFVAQMAYEIEHKLEEYIGGVACDNCGNSCYRIERVSHGFTYGFIARCVTVTGCGRGYPISLFNEDDVQF